MIPILARLCMVSICLIALGACGSDEQAGPGSTRPPAATQRGDDRAGADRERSRSPALNREAFASCGESAGFKLSEGVRGILGQVQRRAEAARTIEFSEEKFGAAVSNGSLLVFDEPQATSRSLVDLRKALGEKRRIIRRDNALIILGNKANRKVLDAVVQCANRK